MLAIIMEKKDPRKRETDRKDNSNERAQISSLIVDPDLRLASP